MMHLLFVSQDFPPDVGGIQTYSAELAERLARRCERFAVVAPRRPGSHAVDAAARYPVHRLPARPDLLVAPALAALPVLARRQRCEVAFHAQWQTVPASLLARRLTGYPRRVVAAAHARELLFNPVGLDALRPAYDGLRGAVLQHVDAWCAVSRYTRGLLVERGVAPERVTVVPNGTNPQRFAPHTAADVRRRHGAEGRPVLLTVGRLVPRKGVDTTLQALPRVLERVPDAVYLVAGDGPDRARLEAMARSLGVAESVRFLGRVPHADLARYYNACDVFVMPARADEPDVEGFGIVFLEAGACGKPVVGAHTGGIPDAVHHGETGLLVPPGAPAELAEALLALLTDAALAQRLGEQGRQRVLREATWDRVAERVHQVLAEEITCTSS